MYYAADLAERGAINKTGLQRARWQNNLSDSMEKEREDKAKCAGRERKRQRECKTDEVGEKWREPENRGLWQSGLTTRSCTSKGKAVFPSCAPEQ